VTPARARCRRSARPPSTAAEPVTPRLIPVLLFLGTLGALLPGLGDQYVWSKDEARPALVAREMVENGHWLVPHLGGHVYTRKPPLFSWLVALASGSRVTEWSLRLPAAMAAATTVAVTYAIGARAFGTAGGLASALLLASSVAFFQWGRTGRMESLLVLWITLAFWSLGRWRAEQRAGDAALFGLWLGLGLLTKGPIALVPLIAAAVAGAVSATPFRQRAAHLAVAMGIAVAAVLAWLGLAALTPAFAGYVDAMTASFAEEVAARPPRSYGYAAGSVLSGFLPWSVALPVVAVMVARAGPTVGRTLLLPVTWAVVVLGVFGVLVSPREAYFLPAYPALALLTGWAWTAASPLARRWLLAAGTIVVAGGGGAALVLALQRHPLVVHDVPVLVAPGVAATLFAMALALALGGAWLARHDRRVALAIAGGAAALVFLVVTEIAVGTPAANRFLPTREAAARFAARLPAGAEVTYLDRRFVTALMFYLPTRGHELRSMDLVRPLLGRPHLHALVVHAEAVAMANSMCLPVRVLHRETLDGVAYVLVDFEGPRRVWVFGDECLPHLEAGR
jgi:4-amino-4-deoxy-L-arabinose transferase-like glycosyltransferase